MHDACQDRDSQEDDWKPMFQSKISCVSACKIYLEPQIVGLLKTVIGNILSQDYANIVILLITK